MKPAPFEYRAPDSQEQALAFLQEFGGDSKLLAGGQSLVPAMNFRVVQPSALIDLNRVRDLDYIRADGQSTLRVGAMTRERQLEFDPLISSWSPLLAETMPHVAHPQIRNRGTLGGSLANADPAAELPVIMLALQARLKVRSASSERWLAAQDFFTGMFSTALAPDEMLVEIELPAIPAHTGWCFMEVAPRAGDYAMMGVAVLVSLDDRGNCGQARLVYLNAGDGPVEAARAAALLVGQALTEQAIEAAAEMAGATEITPYGNIHASPDYQRHLARVLTRRALYIAGGRASGEPR
ncbi:MAG TPA: xanthine dehydrogenase family protein subunit M [Anaerolineales bacterium]|jgi:carbon-monoxide dehydrogenase medium subunit